MLRVRAYGDLNDFLPRARRDAWFEVPLDGRPALKDVLEAAGIPHVEIDLVLLDGVPVTLLSRARDGGRVEVFPRGEGPVEAGEARLLPAPLPEPRFVLDGHLGRLAARLRMLGFDTEWSSGAEDAALAARSAEDERILLTRDVGLLKRGIVRRGAFVRATAPAAQLVEVTRRFDLARTARPFTRCLRCNVLLREVPKARIAHRLPPRVREAQQEFRECPSCGRLYWPGTHHARMAREVPGSKS